MIDVDLVVWAFVGRLFVVQLGCVPAVERFRARVWSCVRACVCARSVAVCTSVGVSKVFVGISSDRWWWWFDRELAPALARERELARGGPTSLGSCVPSSWSWRTVACVCVFVVWWIVGWGVDGRRLVVKERVR